ncbi:hypothetical protein EV363DRAFT_783260 [Boletus edulis]|nr:hypothetical protein EV363DRAFT_783260 [Boletus edulis]
MRPLVVLHDGPGLLHHYVLPFKELRFNIPVIFYNQIGKSSHPKNVPLCQVVLTSAAQSMAQWVESTRQLLQKLPEDPREMFEKHEREGTTDHPEYRVGLNILYAKY